MRWTQSIKDYLAQARRLFVALLLHVVRKVELEHPLPPQATKRARSAKHSSVDKDLIHLASHNHSWYKSNNEKVYFALEEAT